MAQLGLKKRLIIILYIISFTISLFIFSAFMNGVSIDVECTTYSSYAVDGSDIYYAQNIKDKGVLFKLNSKGDASRMFLTDGMADTRILGVDTSGEYVYVITSGFTKEKSKDDEDAFETTTCYHLLELDHKLNLIRTTRAFYLDENDVFTGFSADANGLYITCVTSDGSRVTAYGTDYDQLKDPDDMSLDSIAMNIIRTKTALEGRMYSDALYEEGQLYVRTDADVPSSVFAIDPFIKEVVSRLKLTLGMLFRLYGAYIVWYIVLFVIWCILLSLVVRTISNRNRSFYFILIAEGMLLAITISAAIAVAANNMDARSVEHSRFAVTSLIGLADEAGLKEDIDYDSSVTYDDVRYIQIRDSLSEFVQRAGNNDIFYDVFVYRIRDDYICASASGRNRQSISDIYGTEMGRIDDEIKRGNIYTAVDVNIEGQKYRAVAAAVDNLAPQYALVGIINTTTLDKSVFVGNTGTFLIFIAAFAIGSALVTLAWYLHMRDLVSFEEALSASAAGEALPERPAVIGSDVKDMWDSLAEIHKRVDEIEYTKIKILEAYYRFAPKNVEKALFKKSIIEVENGDRSKLNGSVCLTNIDISGGRRLKKLDSFIGSIGEYQKDHDCMIIGKSPDMSSLQMLFLDTESATVRFITDLYTQHTRSENAIHPSTVIFFDECRFGVMGNEDEATTYLRSMNQDTYRGVLKFATQLRLGIVISEDIKTRENLSAAVRFMGYARRGNSGEDIKLYEVLDAYAVNVRNARIASLPRFNDALDSFYEKDFYIARNKFSDILKENPDDSLVRWYVFEADRYLNEIVDDENYRYIHL
ncbi:MAG: hypothetical protein ILA11_05125 [Butyrivibrio sp.]|nr:hypothetical protein [Butyrivibrio sp.]